MIKKKYWNPIKCQDDLLQACRDLKKFGQDGSEKWGRIGRVHEKGVWCEKGGGENR